MLSPSPTRQPPAPQPEQKKTSSTPSKRRLGRTPTALFVKSVFRPIFKGIYYVLRLIRGHKLIALALILVLLASSSITTYVATGSWPLVSVDPLLPIAATDLNSANHIRDWLYALRDGNTSKLQALEADMLQTNLQPDPASLVARYGQPQTGNTWVSISVMAVHTASDRLSLDSFVEVDLAAPASTKDTISSIVIFHFTTVPAAKGRIFVIDVLPPRQYLPGQ
jgi:hypothetical protein